MNTEYPDYQERVLMAIKAELEKKGIPTTGAYSRMLLLVQGAILSIRINGYDDWSKGTTVGQKLKDAINELAARESFLIYLTQYK